MRKLTLFLILVYSSMGLVASADAHTIVYQAEELVYTLSNPWNTQLSVQVQTGASLLVSGNSTSLGEYITLSFDTPRMSAYELYVTVSKGSDMGIWEFACLSGMSTVTHDLFAIQPQSVEIFLGVFELSAGINKLRFTLQNCSTDSAMLDIDCITLKEYSNTQATECFAGDLNASNYNLSARIDASNADSLSKARLIAYAVPSQLYGDSYMSATLYGGDTIALEQVRYGVYEVLQETNIGNYLDGSKQIIYIQSYNDGINVYIDNTLVLAYTGISAPFAGCFGSYSSDGNLLLSNIELWHNE